MPYADINKRRKCAREWARQHRKKVPWRERRASTDKWRVENRERYLASKKRYYYQHREQSRQIDKQWRVKQRKTVLEHYGGNPPKCACCNEATYEFLTLNHMNGGGTKERKRIGPAGLMRWLINKNFPSGYNVLCYNCNCANASVGICPHQKV